MSPTSGPAPVGGLQAAVASRLAGWERDSVVDRLWRRDGTLWAASGTDADTTRGRMGWLELPAAMSARIPELAEIASSAGRDGYTRAAVLGMGGSSLAPELFARVFGGGPEDGLELRVLDSTHPDAVRRFREWAAAGRTLFLVSSKSGTTTEPLAFHAAMAEIAAPSDFIAITDPRTPLEELARAQGFRSVISAPPDVGGRYSALTTFGLVPAALVGVELSALLDRASAMAEACRARPPDNPGLTLGATIGEAALAGRDKLTILCSPRLAAFGDWAEQLIAESTGKRGRGLVPVVGEPLGRARQYGADRQFVVLRLAGEPDGGVAQLADELEALGHPVMRIDLVDALELGGEFVRWEVATAAAGIVLEIDPFDQPNVQESKDATTELLARFRERGTLAEQEPMAATDGLSVYADPATIGAAAGTVAGALSQLLRQAATGDYVAILAYLPPGDETTTRLAQIRATARDALGVATTVGYGPRFLHSTGQLHKGGPPSGVFVQLTADPTEDLAIPGWRETFGTLIAAQALGDLQSLQRRGRRAARIHLGDVESGLARVEEMVAEAVAAAV